MLTPTIGKATDVELDSIADEPSVTGVKQRYWWAQLEPSKGQYDFSLIEHHLAKLKANGKHLIIVVEERTWAGTDPRKALPAYLGTDPQCNGGWYLKPSGGVVARVWEQGVMDRLIALHQALGARFDSEPYFEGIASEEVAPGASVMPDTYSREAIASQAKRWFAATHAAFPHTLVMLSVNTLIGQEAGLISYSAQNQGAVGGPDVLPPPHSGVVADRVLQGLVGGTDYRGQIPIMYDVQSPELCGKEGCFLPDQLYDHAVNTLHATHVAWLEMWVTKTAGSDKYSWGTGILPMLRRNDGKINTACPANLQGRCSTG